MAQLGRISGPLLTENLLRNGADLAFSNDRTNPATTLLYLDVNTSKIGINNDAPVRELEITGNAKTPNFITGSADIANFSITSGQIENLSSNILIKSAGTVVVPTIRNTDIEINDNYITTYTENTDLRLIANAAGNVVFDGSVEIDNFTLNGVPTFNVVNIDGNLSVIGNVSQAGNLTVNGYIDLGNIKIDGNYISTTDSNSDIEFRASGTGIVNFQSASTLDNNLTVQGNTNFNNSISLQNLTHQGTRTQTGNYTLSGEINTTDFKIFDNNILTTQSNADLELRASGSGIVNFTSLRTDNNFTVVGPTTANNISSTGTVTTPNLNINTDLTVNRNVSLEDIDIVQNKITVTSADTNLNLSPAGSGTVEIFANTNITGSVHATGNVTMDGDFVLGDQNTDNLILNAEISSDIVPDLGSTYDIGSSTKKYSIIESLLLNGETITVDAINVDGSDLIRRQGNIFYVAVNGDDANVGDYEQDPFRTIKHALSVADSSVGGPVTIYVYPGDYEEEFPLTVPANTTVKGLDLRNTIIRPDTSSQSEDAFLLTGETTIEDITIKDFYYDSLNDKGYAFRFAANAITTTRSPYIRNVTVITQGSTTSASDPRGFDAGDAGKGVLVDGTDVNSASTDAAMLFHSCTFITPGVDALTMTGGVRVEWLNCFSYFANRGLYAFNDAVGRVNQDGSTINKGAELRSIGSASVYGNVGAEADGDETLMYLINHNFAYTGTGKDVSNDATLVIQENETIELNSGKIYYTSQDAGGNFRVGDAFVVDFERGTTSLSDSDVALTGISSLTINTGGDETFINAEKIETGNWRIQDNTISALIGDGNIAAASGTINFTNDVNMQSNLSMTGNFTMSGANFTLGNAAGDSVSFEADVDSDIIPKLGNVFTLGNATKNWNYVYLSNIPIDEIEINDNYIQTVNSNADLELRANSTGNILFTSATQVDNDLTVDGIVNLADTVLTTVTHVGNLTHAGNKTQTGDKTVSGQFNVSSTANFDGVQINTNYITSTVLNSDLELRTNGTGEVIVPTNNVEITNDLYVSQGTTIASATVTSSVALEELVVDDLKILDNRILITTADTDLILNPDGFGKIYIAGNNLEIDNNFTVSSETNLSATNITGSITHIGTRSIQGDIAQSGTTTVTGNISTGSYAQFEDVLFSGNVISTTTSNSDLDLRASGTGVVRFTEDTTISNNLQINGTLNTAGINIATSLDLNELIVNNNLEIDDNFITTTISNSNLELRATTGELVNIQDSTTIENNLTVDGTTDVQNTNLTGLLTLVGNNVQQGNISVTGNYNVTGSISTGTIAQFENIAVLGNSIETTISNSDLELRANGTGVVRFDNDTQIDNDLTVQGTITAENISINTNLDLNQLVTPSNILIDDNYITTTETNSNLELRADGTGFVEFQDVQFINNSIGTLSTNLEFVPTSILDINTTGAINLPVGTYAQRTSTQGDIRYNSEFSVFHGYATSNVAFNGVYSDNFLTRVRVNDTDNVLRFDVNNTEIATITDSVNLLRLDVDDVSVDNNVLSTNVLNSDLEFSADGTGEIVIDNIKFGTSTITNTAAGGLLITATDPDTYLKIGGTYGIVITANSTSNRRTNPELAEIRFNTSRNTSEIWNGTEWTSAAGETGTGTSAEIMAEILDEYILIFG